MKFKKNKTEHKYSRSLYLEKGTPDNFIISRVKKGARVLEIGPSFGYMTKYLIDELDATVDIIELDPQLFEDVKKIANKAYQLNLNEIESWIDKLEDNQYDHIIAQDVLEHTIIPFDIIHLLKSKLKRNGTILITYPNFSHSNVIMDMYNQKFQYSNWGLLDETHYRFLSSDKLLEYVSEIGFKLKDYNIGYCLPQDMIKYKRNYLSVPLPIRDIIINKRNAHVATLFYEIVKFESDFPHNPAYFDYFNPGYEEFHYTIRKKTFKETLISSTFHEVHCDESTGIAEFTIKSKYPIFEIMPSIRMRDYNLKIVQLNRWGKEVKEIYNDTYRNCEDKPFSIEESKYLKVKMEYDVKL